MKQNFENNEPIEYKYKFSCKYEKDELIDAYMDRKARIRYKRAFLGTIICLAIIIIFSKSNYFQQAALYKNYVFWCLSGVLFMTIFLRNHHKFMWKSLAERSFSSQTNTYDIYLCEDCINLIFPLIGIKKVFNYDEIDVYEVKDYFILENEYLNGFNISKEKIGKNAIDNVRDFLKSKTKIKNLGLPVPLRKFSRMPIYLEIIIIIILLIPSVVPTLTTTASKAVIGERVVCNNLGIKVKETSRVSFGRNNPIYLYKAELELESFEKETAAGKSYNAVEFKLVSKDGKEYQRFSISDPKEIKSGALHEKESISGDLYFKVPSVEEPEYLIYTTYNKSRSKQYSQKIYLGDKGEKK
ncbi:DUF4352 domain-containing protein [Clostridium peptidivorans]|uniref:DUF4352 domain-containing protein n=1 Tax=Clostridium peptidivorans TaxID=100174 RepID=UPI000BE30339|nr:DUF4352 domain-containing protein [Clostridium peptidivorans]